MIRSGVGLRTSVIRASLTSSIVTVSTGAGACRVATFSKDLILVLELVCYQNYFRFSGEKSLDYLGVKLCTAKGGYF